MATSKQNKQTSDKRMRYVCMTLNNYSPTEYDSIINQSDKVQYMVVGKEVGESGTPHLQMYVEFKANNGKTLTAIKKFFGSDRFHIEERIGTAKQASDYCKKEEDYVEHGEMSQQGARTDWKMALEMIKEGVSVVDVIAFQPQLMPNIRALERYAQLCRCDPLERDVNVTVMYGDAGVGKSRYAYSEDDMLFSKPNGDWWDGYAGEETVLLDDYYGGIMYPELLKVLDRYKLRVPVKGGFVGARWNRVIMTSNKHPSEWYKHGMTPALKRRITECYKLESTGDNVVWYKDDMEGNLTYVKTVSRVTGEEVETPNIPVGELHSETVTDAVVECVEGEVPEGVSAEFVRGCIEDAVVERVKRISKTKKVLIPKRVNVVPIVYVDTPRHPYDFTPVVTDAHLAQMRKSATGSE